MSTMSLAISGTSIRQDSNGRFCLNDLHKASGGENKHRPSYWLDLQGIKDLIEFLETENSIADFSAIFTKQGLGTFAAKELVYSYAMWISAKFQIAVIRAYDAMVSKPYGLVELESVNKTQWGILSAMVADIAISSGKEGATKAGLWSRFNNHFKVGSYKELPAIKFDDAVTYLDAKRDDYDKGFALAVVKKDDLMALGYDVNTKMFAVKSLQRDFINEPPMQSVSFQIPDGVALVATKWIQELEQKSSLKYQLDDLKFVVEKSGGLVLTKHEVDKMKGVLKA